MPQHCSHALVQPVSDLPDPASPHISSDSRLVLDMMHTPDASRGLMQMAADSIVLVRLLRKASQAAKKL